MEIEQQIADYRQLSAALTEKRWFHRAVYLYKKLLYNRAAAAPTAAPKPIPASRDDLLQADLQMYRAQFAGILRLPLGEKLMQALIRRYRKPFVPAQTRTQPGNLLLLCDRYPNPDALYRNAFIHRRVKGYQAQGVQVPVFCMDALAEPCLYEWDGVPVTVGGRVALYDYLTANPQIDTVLVHFFCPMMWDVLQKFPQIRLIIWSHGSDILPWYHRPFLYPRKAEQAFGKAETAKRMAFWQEIFQKAARGEIAAKFVYVSQYLMDLVTEDYQLDKLPLDRYVIPNCVDSDVFYYREKEAAQRLKLLSVRSFASENYANDLTVKALLRLSKEPFFGELEVLIAGNGELFDKTVAPLRKFPNIQLHKGFYTQPALARLQEEYGVAILPTRFDTQGVSRDEAFSSGMAVITTDVACVSEFADESCAILVPPEDAAAIAAGVKRLYESPELFLQLSRQARERAGRLSPAETISREVTLFAGSACT